MSSKYEKILKNFKKNEKSIDKNCIMCYNTVRTVKKEVIR